MSETTAIKEKPILFRAAMVRAILDGRKTQTRRLVKPQPVINGFSFNRASGDILCRCDYLPPSCLVQPPHYNHPFLDGPERLCPYGQPGDRLWVKETWQAYDGGSFKTPFGNARTFSNNPKLGDLIEFKADKDLTKCFISWRSPIHMPRWASRITLEVTEVRVERLQEITEEDAKAEGTEAVSMFDMPRQAVWSCRQDFAQMWDSHNPAPFDWASNPWVWAVSFRRVEQAVRA